MERHEYREWLAADGPAYLCIKGASGTGKSILSSVIIDHLLAGQQQRDVIVYCFLEEGFGKDDYAKHILTVLLRHMQEKATLPDFLLYSLLPEIDPIDAPMSREAFQRSLRILLGNVDCHLRLVLILDGVDKDEWIKWVVIDEVDHINSLRHRSGLIKCLISSQRSSKYITLSGQSRVISLDNELGVQRDVLQYAESRLASVQPTIAITKSYLTSVAKKLCLRGQGNFLWVARVVGSLQSATMSEVENEVDCLPPSIDGLYQRALKSIPSQEIGIMQRALAWLIAANRPLKLAELIEASTTESDPHRTPVTGALASQTLNSNSLIITIRESNVRLCHPSIRRYLLTGDRTRIWGTSIVEAHTLLAQTCLVLITSAEGKDSRFPIRSREGRRGWKTYNYAADNWSFHYGLAESHSKRLAGALHRSLSTALYHDCEELSLPEMGRSYQIQTAILRIAAYYGFASLTLVSLQMGVNVNGSCKYCETPLELAAAGGHAKVVDLLIRRRASTAVIDPSHRETALHLAAACGSQEIVKILLEDDAKVDSNVSWLDRTPLHAAASSGDLSIIKMLIDLHTDLNAMIPISGETPLHLAASRGDLQTVEWLVEGPGATDEEIRCYDSMVRQDCYQSWTEDLLTDSVSTRHSSCGVEAKCLARESIGELLSLCGRYADINMRTREGRTALHLAASNGHVSTVRFLHQTGAIIDLTDNKGYTALQLAAGNGHLNVVKLLLTAGATLDFYQLGATLKSIVNSGHDSVANLLAWHCFSMDKMGKPCQWPVLALATKSKQNTVGDAIRKKQFHEHATARRTRTRAPSQDHGE